MGEYFLEDAFLQVPANRKGVFRASAEGSLNERQPAIARFKRSGAEEQVTPEELLDAGLVGVERALATTVAKPSVEQPGYVNLQVGLETGLPGRKLTRDQSPQPPIGEDCVAKSAPIEVPLDLLRWILALGPDAHRPVKVDVPGLRVSQDGRVLPKLGRLSTGGKGGVLGRVVEEERVVRPAPPEPGLVDQLPPEDLEQWLNEGLFKARLAAVLLDAVAFLLPEIGNSVQGSVGFSPQLGPLRLLRQSVLKPVI